MSKKKEATEKKEENPFHKDYGLIKNTGYILGKIWQYKKIVIAIMIVGAVASSSNNFIWTFITKYIVDLVQTCIASNTEGIKQLAKLIIIAVAIEIVVTVTNTQVNNRSMFLFFYVRMKIIKERIAKALTLNYEKLEDPNALDMMQRALNATGSDTEGVEGMMHSMQDALVQIVSVIAAVGIVAKVSPVLLFIMIAIEIVRFFILDFFIKRDKKNVWNFLSPYWRKINYMEYSTQDFSYGKDIRLYGMKDWLLKKMSELYAIKHKRICLSKNYWIINNALSWIFIILRQVLIYAYLIYRVINKGLSIGDFILYSGCIEVFANALLNLLGKLNEFKQRSMQVDDFRSFLDMPDPDDNKILKHIPESDKWEFKFENVSFKYPEQENYCLKNINVTLESGKRLAIVGLNGAGKTTFVKLLLRLYDVTEGRILLNGVDVREYDRGEYYKIFSPVFQDVNIFAFPLSENVSMKSTEKTDVSKAKEKLYEADMKEKVDSLPKGVNTELLKVLVEDGIDLSGGEKQKLGLARALYKDAPVIILDEPTAALDALAEYKLYQNFDKLIGNKTAIYISHRLSSTRFCDSVAMFMHGNLVEYGTHESLLKKGGEYAHMFEVQAQYYKEGKSATGESVSDENIKSNLSELNKILVGKKNKSKGKK